MNSTATIVFRSDEVESLWAYASPVRMLRDLISRRQLLWQFTAREVSGRYRNSFLGIFWALLNPLLTLSVYTLVFSGIFKAKWAGQSTGFLDYALNMFCGIIMFQVLGESVQTAPLLITQNPNYVKKVVFPLELLPLSLVGSALIHSFLSLAVALVAQLAIEHTLHWTVLLLPLVYLPLAALTAGLCWILASLGVFIRDIGNVMGVVVNLLFFVTPILFPISNVSSSIRWVMYLNPLSAVVENARLMIRDGQLPNWGWLGAVWLVSAIVAVAGYAWFMKIKRAFADVI